MANPNNKLPGSAPGRFFIDSDLCVSCGACIVKAPNNFTPGDGGYYINRQPTTPDEIQACTEALKGCPVDAVGDNGDESPAT